MVRLPDPPHSCIFILNGEVTCSGCTETLGYLGVGGIIVYSATSVVLGAWSL